jgi:hypothetical protein
VRKNRSIKPKIRWKAKKLPDAWQGQHQVLEVQQEIVFSSGKFQMYSHRDSTLGGFFMLFFGENLRPYSNSTNFQP